MELTRPRTVEGLFAEYASFADLIAAVSTGEWDAPTRCAGWAVRDVAAHVTGNVVDSLEGTIGSRTPDEQARALRDRDAATLAEELRHAAARLRPFFEALDDDAWARPSPVPGRTIGNGVLTLWYDTFVHADDIRAALGRPSERGPGMAAAVQWMQAELKSRGWGPARIVLDGLGEYAIGSGGPQLRADPLRFVLVAAGRADPAELGVDETVNIYR